SIVGTNDLHGALERLPVLAGYVANLRAARAADGGGVVLLDGGDLFQGTLESNVAEGVDVVRAYNQIGYAASAVGNHEFDYGPEGPRTVAGAGEDPRGALKARVREAKFPFVTSNIVEQATGKPLAWPNLMTSTLIEVAGVKVGIIGASTEQTPRTTMPANFVGLAMTPPAPAIAEQARELRARGAQVIVATMHIGSGCKNFDNADDASSCNHSDELFKLLAGLPRGAVDVIVAGHTHAGIAHRLEGIAVIESYSSGRAFGRVDLQIGADGRIAAAHIARPHRLCEGEKEGNAVPIASCAPGEYEGKPVVADPAVQHIVDEALARAGERRREKLGITIAQTIRRAHAAESAEGNLFCDLMLAARPDAQVSVTNGGGLRADLPAGELTYGQLFEAIPFDNRFALIELRGKDLRQLVTSNLQRSGGILSWGGLTAKARCSAGKLDVQIRVAGKPLDDTASYKLATSDFLASGGDGMIARLKLSERAIQVTDTIIRDAFTDVLRSWKGTPKAALDPAQLFSPAARRLDYEGNRPLECGSSPAEKETEP
ncbi:MAG TPA: bifunctional UDP-sugar hydrolase/5'-nucleotidase, partial [Kofleriaceae bacterium]|nr:bifunctional UDP-sugar hydrolase/5'-nucleotidase [Kofleriaceae bacterium]